MLFLMMGSPSPRGKFGNRGFCLEKSIFDIRSKKVKKIFERVDKQESRKRIFV